MVEKLDRYELLEVVGTGAFATVWKAHDPVLETSVAIKVLADNWSRDPEMRQRFLSEARMALEVTSPHLIRVHHVAEAADTGVPYIVMTLAEGGTFEQRLVERKLDPFSVEEALLLIREIAVGVAALHDEGILHRDLKPANVLFGTRRGQELPLLGDFGLARALDKSALTMVSGTPAYAAPEQAAGLTQLTKQADLFSLGIMFLEMVAGDVPDRNDMVDAATKTVDIDAFLAHNEVSLNADQKRFVAKLVDSNPENRPADAHAVIANVDRLLSADTSNTDAGKVAATKTPSTPTSTPVPLAEDSGSKPAWLLPVIAGVVLLLVGLGFVFALSRGETTTATEAGTQAVESSTSIAEAPATTLPEQVQTAEIEAADTTTTSVAEQEQAANALNVIPADFPLPTGALLDPAASNANLLQIYRLAGTTNEVAAFYETTPGWDLEDSTTDETTVMVVVANGTETISVLAEPLETTAGIDLTLLTVTPFDR